MKLRTVLAAGALTPEAFRQTLEDLGPTFVKIGQYLALRPDLIPQEYCDALLDLVDRVESFSPAVARRIIEEDLGGKLEEHFAWFNPSPFAAASLAQVHQARTHDGELVAVKVQRPGIRQAVERDLKRTRVLGRLLEAAGMLKVVAVDDVLRELARWMDEELDFFRELENLTRMYELSARDENMRVPRPYPKLCSERVLVLEFLPGTTFADLLRSIRESPDEVRRLGFRTSVLAHRLIRVVLTQIFRFQFFHADTHPGNLIAMEGHRIGFVDFGLADTLDPTFRRGMLRYISAVYANDVERMLDGLEELLVPTAETDWDAFRADFVEQTRTWLRERDRRSRVRRSDRSPLASYMIGVLRAARENGLTIPAGVLSMYRSLLTAESVANRLGSKADLRTVGRSFFARLQFDSALRSLAPEEMEASMLRWLTLFTDAPGQVQRLLSDLADDRFVLRVRSQETRESRTHSGSRAKMITLAILGVAIAILLGSAAIPSAGTIGSILHPIAWTSFFLTWGGVIHFWRRLR